MLALQFLINGLGSGSIIALMAVGFGLILATSGEFHMAHAATFVWGGFLGWVFMEQLGLNSYLSMILVLVFGMGIGWAFDQILYRPLRRRGASRLVILIASLGALAVGQNLAAWIFGINHLYFQTSLNGVLTQRPMIVGIQVVMFVSALMMVGAIYTLLYRTARGREIRAVINSPFTAAVLGINVNRVKSLAYVVASAPAALAGMLVNIQSGTDPYNGTITLLDAAIAVLIGGIGNFWGSVVGAYLLGLIQQYSTLLFATQWQNTVTLIVFLMLILIRPKGLFGVRTRNQGV